jgi:hypothetical protein
MQSKIHTIGQSSKSWVGDLPSRPDHVTCKQIVGFIERALSDDLIEDAGDFSALRLVRSPANV